MNDDLIKLAVKVIASLSSAAVFFTGMAMLRKEWKESTRLNAAIMSGFIIPIMVFAVVLIWGFDLHVLNWMLQ